VRIWQHAHVLVPAVLWAGDAAAALQNWCVKVPCCCFFVSFLQAATAAGSSHMQQQLVQLLPLLQGLALSQAPAAIELGQDGKEAAALATPHKPGSSSSGSSASTDLLAGCITPMPFEAAAAAAPCTPPRHASSSTPEAPAAVARALVHDLSAAAGLPTPLQLPQDSNTHALLARGWAFIKAHVPDVPYFIPAGSCISLDPSLGLPEVFGDCGTRVFASYTAKHGGKGAFMVAKRGTGITAEVRVLRCADGSPASARQHLLGLLVELADHGWAWEAARPRGGRKAVGSAYGPGNGLLLARVQQLVQQLEG
jgi:hypothetical protein